MAFRVEERDLVDVPVRQAERSGLGRIEDERARLLAVKPAKIERQPAVDEDPDVVVAAER